MPQRIKPPFRADHVGSLLRSQALKKAREQRAKGEITPAQLKDIEDREIERVIRKQEEVGLQSITDGEFRRSWWHLDFLWGLDGIEKHVMDAGVSFAAVTTRNEGLKVTGKVGFSDHPMIEHFKFVAAHTKRTPKITIPAPSAAYGRPMRTPIDAKTYPKLDRFFDDLGQAYKKAVRAFADAGCRYLQLDEVFIAMLCDPKYRQTMKNRGDDPEELGELYGDLVNTAMSDIPSDMTITMHMCRGNYKSTYMGAGGYEGVQEILFNKIKVHGYLHGIRHRSCRRFRAAANAAAGQRSWCSAWSPRRAGGWSRRTRSSAVSNKLPNMSHSISCAFRRNAALPRPRRAMSWPRTSNGRSFA